MEDPRSRSLSRCTDLHSGCAGCDSHFRVLLEISSALGGTALRTEYEIAGYEACIAMATTLGLTKAVRLLNSNLKEELAAVREINAAARPILKQSAQQPEEPKKPKTGQEKYEAKAKPELAK